MNKDEMKNKISIALKDPILQQGFEIICRELEQERKLNAEIKARFVKCNTCTPDMKDKCLMFSENLCEGERCEELVDLMALVNKNDLQDENGRLKEELEEYKNGNFVQTVNQIIEGKDKQLTKATEIIKDMLSLLPKENIEGIYEITEEAEQFLKGENVILEDAQAGNSPFDADKVFNKEMKAYS